MSKTVWPDLRAKDVMRTDVVTVAATARVQEAARILMDNRISGAPVTNDTGHLVGVVSMRDVIDHFAQDDARPYVPRFWIADEDEEFDWASLDIPDEDDTAQVSDVMTGGVFSIAADASLQQVAREMVERRVHRLIVQQEQRHVGLISMTDVLRALVNE